MATNKEINPIVFIIVSLILTAGYSYLKRKGIIKSPKVEPAKKKITILYP